MDAKGGSALRDRIERALRVGDRYSIVVETEEDAADLSRIFWPERSMNLHVGDRVEGRITVTDR